MSSISILGAGTYAMAFAELLAQKGYSIRLWTRNKTIQNAINTKHYNPLYFQHLRLQDNIRAETEFSKLFQGAKYCINTIPIPAIRKTFQALREHLPFPLQIINGSKGIERESHKLISEIFAEIIPEHTENISYLSGPSFAQEIVDRSPTGVVIATRQSHHAADLHALFSSDFFFTQHSTDIIGVQICGALKNVIAISLGIADGLDLGKNAQAALIVAGMHEITQIGLQKGAQPETFQGLAGLGDLVLTCTGSLSRNRSFGKALAEGKPLKDIFAELGTVEGFETSHSAYHLALELGVDAALIRTVYNILYTGEEPSQSLKQLFRTYA